MEKDNKVLKEMESDAIKAGNSGEEKLVTEEKMEVCEKGDEANMMNGSGVEKIDDVEVMGFTGSANSQTDEQVHTHNPVIDPNISVKLNGTNVENGNNDNKKYTAKRSYADTITNKLNDEDRKLRLIPTEFDSNGVESGLGRVGYARVLVEVDANKELHEVIEVVYKNGLNVEVGRKNVKVMYDWKPPRCSTCCVFGHNMQSCGKAYNVTKSVDTAGIKKAKSDENKSGVDEEGFMEAKNKRGGKKGLEKNSGKANVQQAKMMYQPKQKDSSVSQEGANKVSAKNIDKGKEVSKKSWKDFVGRVGYARVLVEVDANKELHEVIEVVYKNGLNVEVGRKNVKVMYDWKPPRCSTCCVFGHNMQSCGKAYNVTKSVDTAGIKKAKSDENKSGVDEEGFMEAKNKRGGKKGLEKNSGKANVQQAKMMYQPKQKDSSVSQEGANKVSAKNIDKGKEVSKKSWKDFVGDKGVSSANKYDVLGNYDVNEQGELDEIRNKEIVDEIISQRRV
ncbi:zinc knuckle CX2CX4HX4C [Artemisia annua]|uniref:Zinc knuckle CX2CX4HX4C n=1 Tax=Artemisia annua TaxID=35608 RepID=A0A2U1PAE3_ARTAN|nr:zinc knuckle CX2CX4HX4C [Artemisia annua]